MTWHPDSGRLLYTRTDPIKGEQGVLSTLEGSSRWVVYEAPFRFNQWLLQGSRLLLTNYADEDVYQVGVTGGTPTLLIQSDIELRVVSVSPRHSSVLYASPTLFQERLYLQPLDGTPPIEIPAFDCATGPDGCYGGYVQWADDDSQWLYIVGPIYGVQMTTPHPVVTSLVFNQREWGAAYLPFSNRYAALQYMSFGAYPFPSTDTVPRMMNTSTRDVQQLPFENLTTSIGLEWRYLP